jgi:hypothetical protein
MVSFENQLAFVEKVCKGLRFLYFFCGLNG